MKTPDQIVQTTEETVPGIPGPTNAQPPGWVAPEMEQVQNEEQQAPEQTPAPILRPKSQRTKSNPGHVKAKRRWTKLEKDLGEPEWYAVRDLFGRLGSVVPIAQQTGLTPAHVDHLLDHGIERLDLPPIREHYTNKAEVNLALKQTREEHSTALTTTEAETAITERATQEAAAAQRLLGASNDMGIIMGGLIKQYAELASQGKFEMPETLTRSAIKDLAWAADVHSKTVERAVKLMRLTAGEPTEVLGVQIGIMLEQCTPEEINDALAKGQIPKRLRARVLAGDATRPEDSAADTIDNEGRDGIIDAEYQPIDIDISDEGRVDADE